ncbi:MAG: Crp/Fnr family transcriptional regulator [Muribaculaceae bacterium]|nr:Crp/Fnr family transcriptional regulator [Muribaculaceae bacterium]
MKQLKQLLSMECSYQLRDEIMDQFISSMEEITLHQGDILIADGSLDSNIYIVKEGIMAHTYLSGAKDCCWGFSLPGTMMYSLHPYYFNKPAFYQVIACCDSVVMKQSKERFDNLIAESHEFARWVLSMAQCQLFFFEKKNSVISGDARERFISLAKNRPEIFQKVPMKIIASYLGITQQYLSNLKKEYKKLIYG